MTAKSATPAAPAESSYSDAYWTSRDGLKLHYRDYPGRADRPVVLCLPGLTRNARDFTHVAERIAGDWRVLCVDLRGRGDSAYAKELELTIRCNMSRIWVSCSSRPGSTGLWRSARRWAGC